ncbi:MAG TPA: hypothetical protein VF480_02980, partial [Verrucomicrobiae bacterium]
KTKEQAGICLARLPTKPDGAENWRLRRERGIMLYFRKGLVLTPAHLSTEKVVLARFKDRNFAQLEDVVLVGLTRTQDLEGQSDANQAANKQTQGESGCSRR